MDIESFKIDGGLMRRLREIAKRDGLILKRLIERLILAGMRSEKIK